MPLSSSSLVARHCVLEADPECVPVRERMQAELVESGVPAPPSLVFDLVAAVGRGSILRVPASGRRFADGVARCMGEVQAAMRRAHGSPLTRPSVHLRAARAFLASWFTSAPRLDLGSESLQDLDLIAIEVQPLGQCRSRRWVEWRRSEEEAMQRGGSPQFLRALAEILSATPEGFGAIDERVWTIEPGEPVAPRVLDIASSRKSGFDAERFRSHIGAFHEIGLSSMPPDPARLVAADLALIGARLPEARVLLAAKIADGSLLVRFGSMPRPAARRPQVLFVVALEDDLSTHVLHANKVIPVVDSLREALLHAMPACLRVLADLQIDFEVEVHRSGPFSRGRLRLTSLRTRTGGLGFDYRTAPRLLSKLGRDAPWLFADAPSRRSPPQPPVIAGFDATYLLTAGSSSPYRDAVAWSGCISIAPSGESSLRVSAFGSLASFPSVTIPISDPEQAGRAAASAFGGAPRADDERRPQSAEAPGTCFS